MDCFLPANLEHCCFGTFPSLRGPSLLTLGEEWGRREELLVSSSGTPEVVGEVLV